MLPRIICVLFMVVLPVTLTGIRDAAASPPAADEPAAVDDDAAGTGDAGTVAEAAAAAPPVAETTRPRSRAPTVDDIPALDAGPAPAARAGRGALLPLASKLFGSPMTKQLVTRFLEEGTQAAAGKGGIRGRRLARIRAFCERLTNAR